MIYKSLLFAILFFAAWNIFLSFRRPEISKGQHQWQQNLIEAQEYLYRYEGTNTVMVGSSLSARLGQDLLKDSIYNLSFSGGSIYTGLSIIDRCEKKPKRLLIEINIAERPADKNMLSQLFMPVMFQLRSYLPALREKYQPATLLSAWLSKDKPSTLSSRPDAALVERLTKGHLADYQKLPDPSSFNSNMAQLKTFVKKFSDQGIRVEFYSMPVDCRLENAPKAESIENSLKKLFPEFKFLSHPECGAYAYNDGEHLSADSKDPFEKWLIKQLRIKNY